MTRYVFDNPDAMLHWIEKTVATLLTIPRKDFGKISVELMRTADKVNYEWIIDAKDKVAWQKELFKYDKK